MKNQTHKWGEPEGVEGRCRCDRCGLVRRRKVGMPGTEWWAGDAWVTCRIAGPQRVPDCDEGAAAENERKALALGPPVELENTIDSLAAALAGAGVGLGGARGMSASELARLIIGQIRLCRENEARAAHNARVEVANDAASLRRAREEFAQCRRELERSRQHNEEMRREADAAHREARKLRKAFGERRFKLVELAMGRGLTGPAAVKEADETMAALDAAGPRKGRRDADWYEDDNVGSDA